MDPADKTSQVADVVSNEGRLANASKVGLSTKFIRLFALQVLLISAATLIGIFASNLLVQGVLMRAALEGEADHFWRLYARNPAQPLPNTDNMVGYLRVGDDATSLPPPLAGLPVGHHRVAMNDGADRPLVYVSAAPGGALDQAVHLVLLFDSQRVSSVALYFGIVPLAIVLLLTYALMFVAYRMSQRAISPVVKLAQQLEKQDFAAQGDLHLDLDSYRDAPDAEVASLLDALDHFTARVEAFVERERMFTRDASHELRTPLAVFKGSLDLLDKTADRPQRDLDALRRMRRTAEDMEGLIETLLLLAREEELRLPDDEVSVNDLAQAQVDQLQGLAHRNDNVLVLREMAILQVRAPARVIQVLVQNLLRNAINYTSGGKVELVVTTDGIAVTDTGVGMSAEEIDRVFDPFYRAEATRASTSGHGLGLAIVRRLARQFQWRIVVNSESGVGTEVAVHLGELAVSTPRAPGC